MDKRNWIQISKTLIQKFKIYSLYSSIKSLPLQIFITAVSHFSGPIALLLDKNINHQFILPQNFSNSILIFNCKGELMKSISYSYKDRIIFMGFSESQQLLIVQASGDYFLIDPFSGQTTQGNYSNANEKTQKYRGCLLMPNNHLVMIRQKQLGITNGLTSKWEVIPETRIKFQNPIFEKVFGEKSQFLFLNRQNAIESYNININYKLTIYSDSYLNDNWQNLIAMSYNKERNLLGLVFLPHIIFYIDIATGQHRKFDPMLDLKYDLSCSNSSGLTYKYNSKSAYKPVNYTLCWLNCKLNQQEDLQDNKNSILFYANPKLLIMYDGQNSRMTPRSNCNQLISAQFDSIRVYTQDSLEIYRVVSHLYATVIQIYKINQGYYKQAYRNIIQLHDQFTNYLQKDIIDLSKFDELWKMSNRSNKQQNQNNQNTDFHIIQNPSDLKQRIQKVDQSVIRPLIKIVKYCIDPVDQVKMLRFILFIKNLYNSPIDISELCEQMRILNNLKFQYFNRTLTLSQFQYLKYQTKQVFLTILLRYRMHFIGDIIFQDSESKYKIFLHWAKCKIQKYNQSISFQEIKQKFQSTAKKQRNSKIFTDIAKYCLDRGRINLAEKFIELDQNPDRKIMVYLLMLTSTTDKKLVQKLINASQQSSRSFLIFRVLRQLIQTKWIQNTQWVSNLSQKPNVARHYIRYLKSHYFEHEQQLVQNFYLQNKQYQNLGLFQVQRRLQYNKLDQSNIPKYSQQALNNFIPKVEQFNKLLPVLSSTLKYFNKNVQMQLLRKVKLNNYVPTEQEIKQVKNDIVLQYLGEILIKNQNNQLALSAFKKIKSSKVYTILMRKQLLRDAINLAFQRKDKQAIMEIKQKCPSQLQSEIEERLINLNRK